MKQQHVKFALIYLQHGDAEAAYQLVYPKARPSSLAASACRLLARPDISAFVQEAQNRIDYAVQVRLQEEEVERRSQYLLSIEDKRAIVARIATGQAKRHRYIPTAQGLREVLEDQPATVILRAIELDTRLDMLYNYLVQHHGRKPPVNTYIHAPTLQQQVNILISRTLGEEEAMKGNFEEVEESNTNTLSPAGGGVGGGQSIPAPTTPTCHPEPDPQSIPCPLCGSSLGQTQIPATYIQSCHAELDSASGETPIPSPSERTRERFTPTTNPLTCKLAKT